MTYKWFRADLLALIYLTSGIIGLMTTLILSFVVIHVNVINSVISGAFLIIFLTVVVSGALTLGDIRHHAQLRLSIAHYHRLNSIIMPTLLMISLPSLLGVGVEQVFCMIVIVLLFIAPSWALMRIYHIAVFSHPKKQSWRKWVESGALDWADR